jgi:hypothetical protein
VLIVAAISILLVVANAGMSRLPLPSVLIANRHVKPLSTVTVGMSKGWSPYSVQEEP